ncbi:bifunctional endonuclease V/N-glycosylase UV enzyme protein [Rhizobium phage RHph_I46]|uniref:Bifunctional endonuclease V/N-glycosylase UV enzyme protein n=1 Tax=Rhizobium phage RHph_I1_9 TaxID=2509729 RepID=A0A7S5R9A4_9CAUD|nr:endonuclease V N-glycosylase UV repair enzyme [Rhizobium phage RHph_I1_9]QIG69599.1 bifunctional endonuclease V/N-glycosylase UV enzyme protein [Rhizobium phage RHph_I46]QIG70880.1 bifunctional endonuclease V/N-glycosylase UV enzyme protein [Rhizobium phage RHph_I9]QIG73467.1 bifunctional endonuclease V/N-glycosylase UV enzyme protein [Rhizobium phage RHph_I1_9]QIG76219.1 bifunctional endonuclease V/N-glycosylase UV enzyme protein [Rhizobium phage RHph_I34]
MTRINLIPPSKLHPKHLQGEYYELPRILSGVRKAIERGRQPSDYAHLTEYRMGPGHVTFFYTRLHFLEQRFKLLISELFRRNVRINRVHLSDYHVPIEWFGTWTPSDAEIEISRQRINNRLLTMQDGERWMS